MSVLSAEERKRELVAFFHELQDCQKCPLAEGRTQVVFGTGDPNADLMFVGEAPGFHEDKQGKPFVGQAGKLLDKLLEEIGLVRKQVFVANVLKCLRYNAPVQLEDGSWERIGRLVNSQYSGRVMSVNADGQLVRRRVVGWHATPLAGRRVFRMTYRNAKRAGLGRVCTELTGDHPVLTERGFVPVEELRSEDRVSTGQGLSSVAYDAVCGTLLGDGSLNKASSYLQIGHSDAQYEYALFMSDLLRELRPAVETLNVAAVAGGPRSYAVVHLRTLAHRSLRILGADFYKPAKVVPSWIAERLNERMLAIWFMDDGYMRIRPGGRQPLAEIATNAFSHDDLQTLLLGLGRLGLPAKALRSRLYFDVDASRVLSERIAPFVPPSMRYKLHPEVEMSVPYDQERWRAGPSVSLFDEVEVEDITDRPRGDTTFFCIDVEETNNFVTSGGVVHNCRPPGNRDPQPAEIEQCEPHLTKQIELIRPKVICTLGNFSTKLLTGKPDGITKVHGKPQVHELGGGPVQIFPIYHPAAALYTPSMLETLREDFAQLPGLLEDSDDDAAEVLGSGSIHAAGNGRSASERDDRAPAPAHDAEQLGLFG